MTYSMLALVLVCGCRSALGEASAGYARSWSDDDNGFQARLALGVGDGAGGGGGMQLAVRTGDESSEVAVGLHLYGLGQQGPLAMFGRLTLNALEWDRVGTDDNIGAFSPAVQLGLAPRKGGPCLVLSASRDLRLFHDDATYVGVSVGACVVDTRRSRWGRF
jgi:hypothetical protein